MSDIVQRAREAARRAPNGAFLNELADEIERLRALKKELPKGGPVLAVAAGMAGDFTVRDVVAAVVKAKVPATDKKIYNALGYLTRKGLIKRLGYGRYRAAA